VAQLVIVDPILATEEFDIGPDWLGPDHVIHQPPDFSPEAVWPFLENVEGILTAHYPVTAEMIAASSRLLVIAKPGAGYDNIDVAAATARRIPVCNVEGTRGRSVAEHATLLILHLARHGWMRDDPAWKHTTAYQLGGKTLGIVGLGSAGATLARIGHGFGMDIVVNTRTEDPERVPGVPVKFVDRETLLSESDFVVLCMPLSPETRNMINRESLSLMKEKAFLINVSRGPTVNTDDLFEAMKAGHLAGAGLDVTDPEPLANDHPLRTLPNVFITPHNAGRTHESQAETLGRMADNVRRVLTGLRPVDIVNPEVLEG